MLLVNPYASGVDWKSRMAANSALITGHDLTTVETAKRDDAIAIARQAAEDGFGAVVVLGGDGTLNEAANGLAGTSTALAALPGGSTNVFARTIGMAAKTSRAASQLQAALARADSVRTFGLGTVNGRHFLFHLGVGYDAAVVAQVEKRSSLKRKLGQVVFVYAAFSTWLRHYDHRRPSFALHFPDGTSVDDGFFTICLNTNPYTYLGARPLCVTPDTGPDRGLVTVTTRKLKVRTLLTLFGSALGKGEILRRNKNVDYRTDLTSFTIKGHKPFPHQVDGDYLGDAEELHVSHGEATIRLIVP
ncbi:MAG TPA: diacylglycerol kinase family protein [Acidimicrobiales bacterium]|nr:diacylglycerol kinase family protein [Acidimicrobiales bacterium]